MGGFFLQNLEQLDWPTRTALQSLVTQLNAWTAVDHRPDGTHAAIRATSVETRALDHAPDTLIVEVPQQEGTLREATGHRWLRGPWLFDENGANTDTNIAALRPAEITANQNNYHPDGLDTAVVVELTSDAARTITGLQIAARQKRLLIIGNSGDYTITLAHASSSSDATNRFDLPNDVDLELPVGLYVWLYYDVSSQRWRASAASPGMGQTVMSRRISVSESQLEAADATPIELIPAQGAGIVTVVTCVAIETTVTTAYTTAPEWRVRHAGHTTELVTTMPAGLSVAGPSSRTSVSYPSGLQINLVSTDLKNDAVQLSLSAAPGTPGTGVATAAVQIWYQLWTV